MQKIIILDFSTGEVHIFNFDQKTFDDGESFMEAHPEYCFKESQCEWMITEEIKLNIH